MPIHITDKMSVEEFTTMVRQQPLKFEPMPDRFWEDGRWLFKHVSELIRQYPEQWIVIYQKRVVAAGQSRREARQAAAEKLGDVGPLVVYRLESKSYVYPAGLTY